MAEHGCIASARLDACSRAGGPVWRAEWRERRDRRRRCSTYIPEAAVAPLVNAADAEDLVQDIWSTNNPAFGE